MPRIDKGLETFLPAVHHLPVGIGAQSGVPVIPLAVVGFHVPVGGGARGAHEWHAEIDDLQLTSGRIPEQVIRAQVPVDDPVGVEDRHLFRKLAKERLGLSWFGQFGKGFLQPPDPLPLGHEVGFFSDGPSTVHFRFLSIVIGLG